MSTTTVDMAKVTQALDAGWHFRVYKNPMGTYEAAAAHRNKAMLKRVAEKLEAVFKERNDDWEYDRRYDWTGGELVTDDFTPEQALTRLAYKCHGEII